MKEFEVCDECGFVPEDSCERSYGSCFANCLSCKECGACTRVLGTGPRSKDYRGEGQ